MKSPLLNLHEKGLRVGLIGESIGSVTVEQTALQVGSGSLEVFATPSMIAQMEAAAVSAIDPYLPEGTTSVGIELSVRHLSATPIGERVVAIAEITKIDGRKINLEIRCWDEHELIGEGTHLRYIIEPDEFFSRMERSREGG